VLASARRQPASFDTLTAGMGRFLSYFVVLVISMAGLFFGSMCLIVPGVILGLRLSMALLFAVDGQGPLQSLQASWRATRGEKGNLVVFFVLETCVLVAGLLACGIGLFVAVPVVYLAWAIVYERLAARLPGAQAAAAPVPAPTF
jgi:uncharacterized membrane protein